MDKVYIFGHKNPDTDSICAAISLTYLKKQLGMNAEARTLGNLSKETLYALKKFHIGVPRYLYDVKTQIKNVNYNKEYMIDENKPIIDAFNLMHDRAITGLPLVDKNKNFKGYVSLKEIAADMIYNESLTIDTSFENLLSVLDPVDYLQFDADIKGNAYAVTFDDESFINNIKLDENSIVIVGYRKNIIKYALDSKVKLIILVFGNKLSDEELKLAKINHVNVISSNKSSFKIARVLCLSNPIKSIKRGEHCVTFTTSDYLSDFEDKTAKLKHTNYPILDNKGLCVGMLRTIDTREVNRKKVILVDHNTYEQSVDGLNEAEILEIVDHHNIGDIVTSKPINMRSEAVGSSNTIIYELFEENNILIPPSIAGIMLSGIISDTLLLKSPTTTSLDIMAANSLANMAHVDLNEYGHELLQSGVSIKGMSANQIIYKDNKEYVVDEHKFMIGQVFTTDFNDYTSRLSDIVSELNKISEHNNYDLCALYVTNFLTNDSNIIYSTNSANILSIAHDIDDIHEGVLLKGVVSRKKQIVPNIMDILNN